MGSIKQILGALSLAVAIVLSVLTTVTNAVKDIENVIDDHTKKLSAHIDASNKGGDCLRVGLGRSLLYETP